jgi:hypothetical protein
MTSSASEFLNRSHEVFVRNETEKEKSHQFHTGVMYLALGCVDMTLLIGSFVLGRLPLGLIALVIISAFSLRFLLKRIRVPQYRNIVITEHGHNYHACLEGGPAIWANGNTQREAIGNLIQTHGDTFRVWVK